MLTSAFIFLAVAITTAIIGVASPPQQGLTEIMFWFTAVSLAIMAGFTLAHLGRDGEAL